MPTSKPQEATETPKKTKPMQLQVITHPPHPRMLHSSLFVILISPFLLILYYKTIKMSRCFFSRREKSHHYSGCCAHHTNLGLPSAVLLLPHIYIPQSMTSACGGRFCRVLRTLVGRTPPCGRCVGFAPLPNSGELRGQGLRPLGVPLLGYPRRPSEGLGFAPLLTMILYHIYIGKQLIKWESF